MSEQAIDSVTPANKEEKSAPLVGFAIVTGTPEKAGVGKGRRFDITPRGIIFHGEMSWEQYTDMIRGLKLTKDAYNFLLATGVRYGKEKFGIEKIDQLFMDLAFDHQDATRALGVGQLTFDFVGRLKLDAEHLWVLASCLPDDEAAQAKWAAAVEKHDLSAIALKRSIEAGRVLSSKELEQQSGRGSGGLGFLDGLKMAYDQWSRRLGGRKAILELAPEKKREWLAGVEEVETLIKDVRASLEDEA